MKGKVEIKNEKKLKVFLKKVKNGKADSKRWDNGK